MNMEMSDEWACDKVHPKFNEACINLQIENENLNAWLYFLSSDCVSCPYTRIAQIVPSSKTNVTIDTSRSTSLRVMDYEDPSEYVSSNNRSNMVCELMPNLGQFGVYELTVDSEGCVMKVLKDPVYPYTELFVAFVMLVLVLFGLSGLKLLWHLCRRKYMEHQAHEATKQLAKRRVKAIDTVRGASVLFMIFVNDGAGGYKILQHATWNGLLLGDLVFPCFIWIMGMCIPVALSSQMKRLTPKRTILYGIFKRSVLLFLIGISLNTVVLGSRLEQIRIFGVLQRFSSTYFIVAVTYLYLMPKKSAKMESPILKQVQDMFLLLPQWCIMIVILAIHCILTFWLAVPGCPIGYIGPGGLHKDGVHFTCVGGTAGYIDRLMLNENHLLRSRNVYRSPPFDPEGILGILTSTFHVYLGLHAGTIMMLYKDWKERVVRWLFWAILFGGIGCVLHFTSVIPVNKSLWSLSFVFVTTSFSLAFLTACYLLVDVFKVWNGGPFRIPGMNALLLYVGHTLCFRMFPFHWTVGTMDSRAMRLLEAIWGVGLWTIIAYIMHKKRSYISL